MKPFFVAAAVGLLIASPAFATDPALTLHQGDIFTDPVGTVISVSVTNTGTQTLAYVAVNCSFTTKGEASGSAGTRIYNVVAGAKGEDQVHLMGAQADHATCSIAASAPAP